MEILQRKMQGDTVRYCFSFIEHQNAFSSKLKKAERYKYVTLQFPLGGHGDRSTKLLDEAFHERGHLRLSSAFIIDFAYRFRFRIQISRLVMVLLCLTLQK